MTFRKVPGGGKKLPQHRTPTVVPKTIRGVQGRATKDAPSFGFTRGDSSRSKPGVGQGSQDSRNYHGFLFAEKLEEGVEVEL